MVGGLVMAMGYILAFFATSLEMLIFTFGVFSGVGMTLVNGPAKVCLGRYFDKRRGLANSCSFAGTAVGQLFIPPLVSFLMVTYGMRGTMLIYGGVCLNIVAVGALMRPFRVQCTSDSVQEQRENRGMGACGSEGDCNAPLLKDCNQNNSVKRPTSDYSGIDVSDLDSTNEIACSVRLRCRVVAPDEEPGSKECCLEYVGSFNGNDTNRKKREFLENVNNGYDLDGHNNVKSRKVQTNANIIPSSVPSKANAPVGLPFGVCCLRLSRLFAKVFDVSLLTNPLYALFVVSTGICLSSTANQVTFIVPWAEEIGLSRGKSAMLISLIGGLGVLGNLLWGFVADLKFLGASTLMSIGMLCTSVCALALCYLRSYPGLVGAAMLYGLCENTHVILNLLVMKDFVGLEKFPKAVGLSLFCYGGINVALAPLLGLAKDYSGTYSTTLIVTASLQTVSALLLIALEPVARRHHYSLRGVYVPPKLHVN